MLIAPFAEKKKKKKNGKKEIFKIGHFFCCRRSFHHVRVNGYGGGGNLPLPITDVNVTHCRNFRIFLLFRFYVKSILAILQP